MRHVEQPLPIGVQTGRHFSYNLPSTLDLQDSGSHDGQHSCETYGSEQRFYKSWLRIQIYSSTRNLAFKILIYVHIKNVCLFVCLSDKY